MRSTSSIEKYLAFVCCEYVRVCQCVSLFVCLLEVSLSGSDESDHSKEIEEV